MPLGNNETYLIDEGAELDTALRALSPEAKRALIKALGGLVPVDGSSPAEGSVAVFGADGQEIDEAAAEPAGLAIVTKEVTILVFDDSQNVAVADGAGDVFYRIPSTFDGMNLVAVAAQVQTAGTTGTTDVQIARTRSGSTVDMLSTKLTIDSTEIGTLTAATPAVINTSNDDVQTGDQIRIDVDAVSTTPPKGLVVELQFRFP